METLLSSAGVPTSATGMIPSIIDTCRDCRAGQLAGPKVSATVELTLKQNVDVDGDIMFYKTCLVCHMVGRADRFHAGCEIANKVSQPLFEAIDTCWVQVFGPIHPPASRRRERPLYG